MMQRTYFLNLLSKAFEIHPIVVLLGPRQCGKTTLAKQFEIGDRAGFSEAHYFDLEKPTDLGRLANPYLYLSQLKGLIILDEIQTQPSLFPILRSLADEASVDRKFLLLGSASTVLIQNVSESLAGRVNYFELSPFSLQEVGEKNLDKLWLVGGFPRAFLSSNFETSFSWLEAYIRSFLEQDIPNLGIRIPAAELRRFWLMLTHNHAQIFNASELGKSLGLNHKTIRNYLDILTGTFMIRELPAWHENISKRQVKSPKIYFRDTGILHSFLGVNSNLELHGHIKCGASWEGFALEQVIKGQGARMGEYYFWSTQHGAELDLLILKNGKRFGYEFKFSEAPKVTKSMRVALEDLKLDRLEIIYPGPHTYVLDEKIQVRSLQNL